MDNHKNPIWFERIKKWASMVLSRFSKLFDKIIYHKASSIIVSLLASIVICVSISYDDIRFSFFNAEATTLNVPGVSVEVKADTDKYEITGIPNSVDLTLTGVPADIQSFRNQSSTALVVADLRNFGEGSNVVTLQVSNVPSQINVAVNPATLEVNLIKKVNRTYLIQFDLLLGAGQKASDFQTPTSSVQTVTIRATQEKQNSIRKVEAIVDTTGHSSDFTIDAPLVAYDSNGNKVDVEMNPTSVEVSVKTNNEGKTDSSKES